MSQRVFNPSQEDFIRENVEGINAKFLAEMLNKRFRTNFTVEQVKSFKKNHHVRSGYKVGSTYTPEQQAFIREFAPGHNIHEIIAAYAERFGRVLTVYTAKNLKVRLGVKSHIKGGHWLKGHTPMNKGKKWAELNMSAEAMENCRKTQFKKGQLPLNNTPVGTERLSKDGYIEVRTEQGKYHPGCGQTIYYRLKHHAIWEAANGPIPPHHNIVFLDGNRLNCSLENLQLVSRSEFATVNKLRLLSNNTEANKAALLVAKVLRAASIRARGESNKLL